MKNKALNALAYAFAATDKVLVDANILVSLFSGLEPPHSYAARDYSRVLKAIRLANAEILLDVLILSEFVNACARKNFALALSQGGYWPRFKDYRQSPEFPPVAAAIAQASRQIVTLSRRIDHAFSTIPIEDILDDFGTGQHDINDQLLVQVCVRERALLLTNDTDFQTGGITVLTTHPKLLASCP